MRLSSDGASKILNIRSVLILLAITSYLRVKCLSRQLLRNMDQGRACGRQVAGGPRLRHVGREDTRDRKFTRGEPCRKSEGHRARRQAAALARC